MFFDLIHVRRTTDDVRKPYKHTFLMLDLDRWRMASETTTRPDPFSTWRMFKRHIPRLLVTISVDIVLPLLIYFLAQKHVKSVYALLLAGTPPLLMIVIKGLLSRTFDALGFLVLIGFVISSVVAIVTRNAIILLLEKSLVDRKSTRLNSSHVD